MRQKLRHLSRGVTLVELLIVIGIIAIMLSLLLPAIQMVRTSSMRTSCQNNRRNLTFAVQHFMEANHRFPAPPTEDLPSGWALEIMPFIEAQAWRDRFVLDAPLSDPRNLAAAANRPEVFVCPLVEYRLSGIAGIPAADYVIHVDARSRRLHYRRVNWSLFDASKGSRTPWCFGPEINDDERATYEYPHHAEGGLGVLVGD